MENYFTKRQLTVLFLNLYHNSCSSMFWHLHKAFLYLHKVKGYLVGVGCIKETLFKGLLQHTSTKVSFSQILLPCKKCLSINLRCFPFLQKKLFCGCSISLLCQYEWFSKVSFWLKKLR